MGTGNKDILEKTLPSAPILVFGKTRYDQIATLREEGSDPFPGVRIVESQNLPIPAKPRGHPFALFIGGRTEGGL